MTHISTIVLAAVAYSVVTRTVTDILHTWPSWLLMAVGGLLACSLAVVSIGVLAAVLFVFGLVGAIQDERARVREERE